VREKSSALIYARVILTNKLFVIIVSMKEFVRVEVWEKGEETNRDRKDSLRTSSDNKLTVTNARNRKTQVSSYRVTRWEHSILQKSYVKMLSNSVIVISMLIYILPIVHCRRILFTSFDSLVCVCVCCFKHLTPTKKEECHLTDTCIIII
jgi:hypothetical protein